MGSRSNVTGLSGSPCLPGCTLRSSTTSASPPRLLLLLLLLRGLLPRCGVDGVHHQLLLLLLLLFFTLLLLLLLWVMKDASREGKPTDRMPWSLAALLLTNTRAAHAHEVGGFHTRPAITTHCNSSTVVNRLGE